MSHRDDIYLDNQATTAVDPRVMDAMLPYFTEHYGNPASRKHAFGWEAADAVEVAREKVANLVHCRPGEVIFTSGATEADNLALSGIAAGYRETGKTHIITLRTEHKAILDTCDHLKKEGFHVTCLDVNSDGLLGLDQLTDTITRKTILVSVMHGNNEIGVIQPIEKIAGICATNRILFHTDAAQSAGKIPINFSHWGIDLLSLSAHKMYGPKGVGALVIRRKSPPLLVKPILYGGGHERGMRSGTLPVPSIVGFGKACELSMKTVEEESARITGLRNLLLKGLTNELTGVTVNGSMEFRLPGNLNLSFAGINSEALIMGMPGIAVSTGSACKSSSSAPSYVLKALGRSDEEAHASIRLGIGRFNTEAEISVVIRRIVETVTRLRR